MEERKRLKEAEKGEEKEATRSDVVDTETATGELRQRSGATGGVKER